MMDRTFHMRQIQVDAYDTDPLHVSPELFETGMIRERSPRLFDVL